MSFIPVFYISSAALGTSWAAVDPLQKAIRLWVALLQNNTNQLQKSKQAISTKCSSCISTSLLFIDSYFQALDLDLELIDISRIEIFFRITAFECWKGLISSTPKVCFQILITIETSSCQIRLAPLLVGFKSETFGNSEDCIGNLPAQIHLLTHWWYFVIVAFFVVIDSSFFISYVSFRPGFFAFFTIFDLFCILLLEIVAPACRVFFQLRGVQEFLPCSESAHCSSMLFSFEFEPVFDTFRFSHSSSTPCCTVAGLWWHVHSAFVRHCCKFTLPSPQLHKSSGYQVCADTRVPGYHKQWQCTLVFISGVQGTLVSDTLKPDTRVPWYQGIQPRKRQHCKLLPGYPGNR